MSTSVIVYLDTDNGGVAGSITYTLSGGVYTAFAKSLDDFFRDTNFPVGIATVANLHFGVSNHDVDLEIRGLPSSNPNTVWARQTPSPTASAGTSTHTCWLWPAWDCDSDGIAPKIYGPHEWCTNGGATHYNYPARGFWRSSYVAGFLNAGAQTPVTIGLRMRAIVVAGWWLDGIGFAPTTQTVQSGVAWGSGNNAFTSTNGKTLDIRNNRINPRGLSRSESWIGVHRHSGGPAQGTRVELRVFNNLIYNCDNNTSCFIGPSGAAGSNTAAWKDLKVWGNTILGGNGEKANEGLWHEAINNIITGSTTTAGASAAMGFTTSVGDLHSSTTTKNITYDTSSPDGASYRSKIVSDLFTVPGSLTATNMTFSDDQASSMWEPIPPNTSQAYRNGATMTPTIDFMGRSRPNGSGGINNTIGCLEPSPPSDNSYSDIVSGLTRPAVFRPALVDAGTDSAASTICNPRQQGALDGWTMPTTHGVTNNSILSIFGAGNGSYYMMPSGCVMAHSGGHAGEVDNSKGRFLTSTRLWDQVDTARRPTEADAGGGNWGPQYPADAPAATHSYTQQCLEDSANPGKFAYGGSDPKDYTTFVSGPGMSGIYAINADGSVEGVDDISAIATNAGGSSRKIHINPPASVSPRISYILVISGGGASWDLIEYDWTQAVGSRCTQLGGGGSLGSANVDWTAGVKACWAPKGTLGKIVLFTAVGGVMKCYRLDINTVTWSGDLTGNITGGAALTTGFAQYGCATRMFDSTVHVFSRDTHWYYDASLFETGQSGTGTKTAYNTATSNEEFTLGFSASADGTDGPVVAAYDETNDLFFVATRNVTVFAPSQGASPLAITSDGGGATASKTIAENTVTAWTTAAASGGSGTYTFSLTGGADELLFDIDPDTGDITPNFTADYEAPADSGANNTYEVTWTVDDGTDTLSQTITFTVTNVNESPSWNTPAALTVLTGTTHVCDLSATDPEGAGLTYSKTGNGADQAKFSAISGASLDFASAPDVNSPTDANSDNVYVVEVQVSDGVNPAVTRTLAVQVIASSGGKASLSLSGRMGMGLS